MTLNPENLPSDGLNAIINGYFAIGGTFGGYEPDGNWGDFLNGIQHLHGSTGEDSFYNHINFQSFSSAITSNNWNSIPFENRPEFIAVHYIMKV